MWIRDGQRIESQQTSQAGVVMIITLILLVVLSLLSTYTIRGATSAEQVSNQSRVRNLAYQAAQAALRYCETEVQLHEVDSTKGFAPEAAPVGAPLAYHWQNLANWDGVGTYAALKTVAFTAAGDAGGVVYFKRSPECMVQYLKSGDNKTFVTTARGFGAEVAAKDGSVPSGTEVWLQSIVTMK